MKKIYLSILALAIVGGASAQVEKSATNVGKIQSPKVSKEKPATNSNAAPKVTLWTNSFGTPSDWSFVDNSGSGDDWVIGTGVPSGSFAIAGIASSSAGDGFALYDSDLMCSGNQNADVITQVMYDFSASGPMGLLPAIAVEFESFYRNYQGDVYVIASPDGITWTEVQVHADVDVNADSGNPAVVSANVSSIIGGMVNPYIGFRYVGGCDYAWMVDDVSIVTLPDNDIAVVNGWHGDILNDFEYSMTPLTQVRPMVAGVIIQNQGGQAQTVNVTCDVMSGAAVVATQTVSHTSAVGAYDTLWFNTAYTPSANGVSSARFTLPADMDVTDDVYTTSTLTVNNDLMAHDYGAVSTYGYTVANSPDIATEPYGFGNIYIPEVNQTVYGIDVNFGTGTTTGLYFLASIKEMTGASIQDPLNLVAQTDFTVSASDIGTSAITTLVLPTPANLVAGTSYIVELIKIDGTTTEEFRVGGSDVSSEDDDYSTVGWGPFGTGNAVNYYNGFGFAPYIRANFNASLSVGVNTLAGVSVYPNPSEGVITVTNGENTQNTIVVTDLTGKVVYNSTVNTITKIDLGANASGIYIVKVANENGSLVERVVIK